MGSPKASFKASTDHFESFNCSLLKLQLLKSTFNCSVLQLLTFQTSNCSKVLSTAQYFNCSLFKLHTVQKLLSSFILRQSFIKCLSTATTKATAKNPKPAFLNAKQQQCAPSSGIWLLQLQVPQQLLLKHT